MTHQKGEPKSSGCQRSMSFKFPHRTSCACRWRAIWQTQICYHVAAPIGTGSKPCYPNNSQLKPFEEAVGVGKHPQKVLTEVGFDHRHLAKLKFDGGANLISWSRDLIALHHKPHKNTKFLKDPRGPRLNTNSYKKGYKNTNRQRATKSYKRASIASKGQLVHRFLPRPLDALADLSGHSHRLRLTLQEVLETVRIGPIRHNFAWIPNGLGNDWIRACANCQYSSGMTLHPNCW